MNKKLSELTEKITSLSADDLLYASVNGSSVSIKASTVEAPLKAYADQKKSEVITEITQVSNSLQQEITNRQTADTSTLQSAKSYADGLVSNLQVGDTEPVGVIKMFAGSTAPTGYVICDGSEVSRSGYSDLYSVIGDSFGSGDGVNTFNLPNPDGNVNIKYIIKI